MNQIVSFFSRPEVIERMVMTAIEVIIGLIFVYFVWRWTKKQPVAEKNWQKLLLTTVFFGLVARYLYFSKAFFSSSIFTTNKTLSLTTFLSLFLIGLFSLKFKNRARYFKTWLTVILLINLGLPLKWSYTYEFPALWLPIFSDFFLLFILLTLRRNSFALGLSTLTFLALAMTLLNVSYSDSLAFLFKIGFTAYTLFVIWKNESLFSTRLSSNHLLLGILIAYFLPSLSSFFEPMTSDADITTIMEFIGYHIQGISLLNAPTGFPGEILNFRYPAGLSALAYSLMWILKIEAAQSVFLLWYLAYGLMIFALVKLSQTLKIDAFLTVLFSISFTILGWQGFGGGQVQEQLAYALGIYSLVYLLETRIVAATLVLCAGAVIQPMVVIPFALAFGFTALRHFLLPMKISFHSMAQSVCLFALTLWYFLMINQGTEIESQPALLLRELTPILFIKNVIYWFAYDTAKLFPMLLIIPWMAWRTTSIPTLHRWALVTWLVGAILLDGLFGHTHWTARNHAGYSIVGLFALVPGLFIYFFQISGWDIRKVQRAYAVFLFLWLVQFAVNIPVLPNAALTSRDDIKMGIWLRKNLNPEALIFNGTYPGVEHYFSWPARGESGRNTVISRIGDHQITKMTLKSKKPAQECITGTIETMSLCLKQFHISHLWISSERYNEKALANIGVPDHRIGNSVLFNVRY